MRSKLLKIAVVTVLSLAMILSFASCGAGNNKVKVADPAEGTFGNLTWKFDETQTLTIEGASWMDSVEDAANVPWKSVASSVKKIVIKSTVTCIGDYAFYYMTALEEVVFEKAENGSCGMQSIGDYAFAFCKNLKSISIPESVIAIGKGAFSTSGLTAIDLPMSTVELGANAFEYCASLKTVVIRGQLDGNSLLNSDMFRCCRALETIHAPANKFADIKVLDKQITFSDVATYNPESAPAETQPPVDTAAPTETVADTTADTGADESEGAVKEPESGKMGPKEIIAIIALGVLVVAIVVGIILFIRYDKKHSGNTTTVVKNKDDKKKK